MKNYQLLEDSKLESVTGGRGDYDDIAMLGLLTTVVSAPVAFGCTMARTVKNKKIQEGTLSAEKVAEYNKSIEKLDIAASVTTGLACVGLVALIGGSYASNRCPNNNGAYINSLAGNLAGTKR